VTQSSKAVFLSYASEDAEAAKRIADTLRAAGIDAWFDQSELRGGDVWDRQIRMQIRQCRLFLPIVSRNSEARAEGYFRREWKLAVERTHDLSERVAFLVPIVIDATPESKADVPDAFRAVQWTRLPNGEPTTDFAARISGLLGVEHLAASDEPKAAVTAARAPTIRRQLLLWVALAFCLVVAVLGGAYYIGPGTHPIAVPQTIHASAESPPAATAAATTIPEKSVAVLPFVDMSEKHDQEYFSDGLAEELIDKLVQVSDLHIPARTSSFYYKGRQVTIRDIGAALGVAHVLEGSVRKSGTMIRITAQLIRVDNGYHVWSKTYDRKLADVFKIQDEISEEILRALNLALTSSAGGMSFATSSLEANDLYMRSRAHFFDMTEESAEREVALLRRAVELDPGFARAWAALSRTREYQAKQFYRYSASEATVARRDARGAAERAVALAPLLADGHLALGRIFLFRDKDIAKARVEIERALTLEPHNSDAVLQMGSVAREGGHLDEALPLYLLAHALDPLNANNMVVLGEFYVVIGDGPSAETIARKLGALYPTNKYWRGDLAEALAVQGRAKEAFDAAEGDASDEYDHLWNQAMFYPALGRPAEADAALGRLERADSKKVPPFHVAAVYAHRGNNDRALEWLDRQYASDPESLSAFIDLQPEFVTLRGDKRFQALRTKLRLPELHLPALKP
jgi:TolB-like protein/Flp pilus assembly protein TadD